MSDYFDVEAGFMGQAATPLAQSGTDALKILQRAVVVDTLDNLSLRDDEYLQNLREMISNPEDLEKAPRNSIVAKLSGLGRGRTPAPSIVCFPFFSSHIALPLKAGEQVWILFETPQEPETRGWWLTRIHEPLHAEDPNYTHGDRRKDPTNPEDAEMLDIDGEPMEQKNPSFHNGPDRFELDQSEFTLLQRPQFEVIVKQTIEANDFVIEPVPRFTKRPGDLVLQGSHNTAIVLGTRRGYNEEDTPDNTKSNAHLEEPLLPGLGAIDIVTGRGRIDPEEAEGLSGKDDPNTGATPERTEPQVAMNSRESFETNKNPNMLDEEKSNFRVNVPEGDPDFFMDASRVYLTMKSEGDADLNLKYPDFADSDGVTDEKPYAMVKSDEVRIVGRQEGSVRIVKEGAVGDDQCVIVMKADGTVVIDAKKIIIGDGRDDQTFLGNEATEPLVRGDMLVSALETWKAQSQAALSFPLAGNLSAPLVIPGWGGACDALISAVKDALSPHSKTK